MLELSQNTVESGVVVGRKLLVAECAVLYVRCRDFLLLASYLVNPKSHIVNPLPLAKVVF
jgi:hypothetical protein